MTYPPPPISHRLDGLVLDGWCRCGPCKLVVQPQKDGTVLLSLHGTAEHSISLTVDQRTALAGLLDGGDELTA